MAVSYLFRTSAVVSSRLRFRSDGRFCDLARDSRQPQYMTAAELSIIHDKLPNFSQKGELVVVYSLQVSAHRESPAHNEIRSIL